VDEVTLRLSLRELERLVQAMDSEGIRVLLDRLAGGPVHAKSIMSHLLIKTPHAG